MGRIAQVVIALVAPLVPEGERPAWQRQWMADLHHQRLRLARLPRSRAAAELDLIRRALGAGRHALWLRLRRRRPPMLVQDLRDAYRGLRHWPGFTAVVVLTIGLAVGANATIFSWVDALAFNAVPGVTDESTLVAVHGTSPTRSDLSFSYPNYLDLRDHLPAGMAGVLATRNAALAMRVDGGEPERMWAELVSGNYFDVLGVRPAAGRLIAPADDGAELAAPVVVLSDRLWHDRFGSRPDVVGSSVVINGRPFQVIGLTPAGFKGALNGLAADAWAPIAMQRALVPAARLGDRGNGWLFVIARLTATVPRSSVQAALNGLSAQLAATYPADRDRGMGLFSLSADGAGQALLPVTSVVMAVVAVVLIVASLNVAGLSLARGSGRRREVAIRLSLGASRMRVVRQQVMESAVLAALGGLAGLAMAAISTGTLVLLLPPLPFAVSIPSAVNGHVWWLALAAVSLATLTFGLMPAWQTTKPALLPGLRDGTGATTGWSTMRLRRAFVAAQVAFALLLLIGAGLFARAAVRAHDLDPGFAERHGVLASVDLGAAGLDATAGRQFYRDAVARIEALPGVRAATVTTLPPLSQAGGSDTAPTIAGYAARPNEEVVVFYSAIGPHYFEVLRQPIIAGRPIEERDTQDTPLVVVINKFLADRYFQGRSPVGGRLDYGSGWATVIGVAANVKYSSLTEPPRSVMYLPIDQLYRPTPTLMVATTGDPHAILPALRRSLTALNPNVPLFEVRTLAAHIDGAGFVPRLASWLLSGFGVLSSLLAVLGLYGVVAIHVASRTREIGVRMALGAARPTIRNAVLASGLRLALVGIGGGLLLAAGATPLLSSQLMGVRPYDPAVIAGAALLLIGVTAVASWAPAWRASHIDPIAALRKD